jgi:hypothetical protein
MNSAGRRSIRRTVKDSHQDTSTDSGEPPRFA